MDLDHNFVQVSKLSEDQKKDILQNWNTFFARIQMRTKKKGLHQEWNTFFPEFKWTPTLRCTPASNYWGDADIDHTQTIGGIQSNYWVGYTPPIPPSDFGTPACRHQCVEYYNSCVLPVKS